MCEGGHSVHCVVHEDSRLHDLKKDMFGAVPNCSQLCWSELESPSVLSRQMERRAARSAASRVLAVAVALPVNLSLKVSASSVTVQLHDGSGVRPSSQLTATEAPNAAARIPQPTQDFVRARETGIRLSSFRQILPKETFSTSYGNFAPSFAPSSRSSVQSPIVRRLRLPMPVPVASLSQTREEGSMSDLRRFPTLGSGLFLGRKPVPILGRILVLGTGFLAAACGGDGAPSAPAPAPAPTPAPAPAPAPEPERACTAGLVLQPGESCTYPGTSEKFTVNADGTATFLFSTSGNAITVSASNYQFAARRQSNGSWLVERVGADTVTGGGGSGSTFVVGDRIPNFPQGSDGIPNVTSGASVSLSGGRLTITMRRNGYVEYDEYRYTCSASECRIEDGLVTTGVVERSAATGGGREPTGGGGGNTFGSGDRIPNFPQGSDGIPNVTSGASVSLSGGRLTITMRRNGYVEYDDYRYTCSASECRIEDGLVTAGVVERTASTGGGGSSNRTDGCSVERLGTLGGTTPVTRSGSLGRDCVSPNYGGELARYYSFTLAQDSGVRIDMESSAFDAWLTLREGSDISGRMIESDDDGGAGTDARIETELGAGTYTIEATSLRPDRTGGFTLRVALTGGSAEPTGPAVVSAGELTCNVKEQIAGGALVSGTISGRLRAVRPVLLVTVHGTFTERDGDQKTHTLPPTIVGSMSAGETKPFTVLGLFSTNATRFGCSARVEWQEIRQAGRNSIRMDAPHPILRSPPN